MAHYSSSWISTHVHFLHDKSQSSAGLPFADLLSAEAVEAAMKMLNVRWRQCGYTPAVTIWTFLSQVLSPDHSCRNAVARLRAHQIAAGQKPVQPDTSPYCKARSRLPEELIHELATQAGSELHRLTPGSALLDGRPIKIADGTTLSMPDTIHNQAAYPQPTSQQPELGFPMARVVGLISASTGAVLDLAIGPYSGKQTGESALLRQLLHRLENGDILVADRYYGSYWLIAMLRLQGVDCVFPLQARRRADFRRGTRLGNCDHIVVWERPQRPNWMSCELYQQLPEQLTLRELLIRVPAGENRKQDFVVVTTLCDPREYPAQDIAETYRLRWDMEIDFRSIKHTMQMDILRCKSPNMVRKEIWMHVLAYNLIRTVMHDAALRHEMTPREISFKATLQAVNAIREVMTQAPHIQLPQLYNELLHEIAFHAVRNRPDRNEPRAIKRDPKKYPYLRIPRKTARKYLWVKT